MAQPYGGIPQLDAHNTVHCPKIPITKVFRTANPSPLPPQTQTHINTRKF